MTPTRRDRWAGAELVSFVVPTRNSARTIRTCLESIRAQRYGSVEVIVVDNASNDGTRSISESLADRTVDFGPERSAQRNEGARLSHGSVLVFVDSDMVLEPGVAEEAMAVVHDTPLMGAAVIPERSFGEGFWARCRVLEKELYLGDSSVEAARIFRREAFESVGGYDEALTGPEDFDLPDRVSRAGWKIGRIASEVWHDEGRVDLVALFRKKRYYGRGLSRYLSDSSSRPRLRRGGLLAHRAVLARQPAVGAGLVLLKLVDVVGLATGFVDGKLMHNRPTSWTLEPFDAGGHHGERGSQE